MIKQLNIPLREHVMVARHAAGGAEGGADGKLNVNKSLKPFVLLATHNPSEITNWSHQFKAYFRSSNIAVLEKHDQQIYLQSCVEHKLFSRIFGKLEEATPMFDDWTGLVA